MANPSVEGDSTVGGTPGVKGTNTATFGGGVGVEGDGNIGVVGVGRSEPGFGVGIGVQGSSQTGLGVFGFVSSKTVGVQGTNEEGLLAFPATDISAGVFGTSQTGSGVMGLSSSGDGVGGSGGSNGVHGNTSNPTGSGVLGQNAGGGHGVSGSTTSAFVSTSAGTSGVWGDNQGGGPGVKGTSKTGNGVIGFSISPAAAVSAVNTGGGVGVFASGSPAGEFQGDVQVTGKLTVTGDHHCTGTVTVDGAGDVAEDFAVDAGDLVGPGTVTVLDESGFLRPCQKSYDQKAVGVISGAGSYRPALVLDRHVSSDRRVPVALVGKVFCKVDASGGAIAVGDLLTTSATLGHAMKASDPQKAFGSVIGKALGSLQAGHGLIPILVTLQ